jgi:hypothetical protein
VSLLAQAAFKHTNAMPHGLVSLADSIAQFLGAKPAYHPEQLHLYEFAAYEINRFNDSLDLDLLVRKKPFREEKEGHLANDVDSDEQEYPTERRRARDLECICGACASDESDVQDDDVDAGVVRRVPVVKFDHTDCITLLRRDAAEERLKHPGHSKEADKQMKAYRIAFKGLLDQEMPPLHADAASVVNTTWKHNDAKLFQAVVMKHARGAEPPAGAVVSPEGLTEADLLQMHVRNDVRIHDTCETVPLDDVFKGRHMSPRSS